MEPVQILDQDQERILQRLTACEETNQAQKVIEEEMGRILVGALQEGDFAGKEQALALMLGTARASTALMDVQAEPVVYEKRQEPSQDGKKELWKDKKLLLSGLAVSAAGALLPSIPFLGGIISLLRLALVGAGIYLSYRGLGKETPGKQAQVVVKTGIDPEKTYHQTQILLQVGTELVRSLPEPKKETQEERFLLPPMVDDSLLGTELDQEEVKLMASLLEAAQSGESQALLEVESQVKFFLHRHGIEVVSDYEENPDLFDRMPGRMDLLIRPALILDGKPLCRGLYVASHEKA